MARTKLPIDIKTLSKVGQVFEGETDTDIEIEVLVDQSTNHTLLQLCRSVLKVRPGTLELKISTFGDEMPQLSKEASLTIIVAGSSQYLKRMMEIALWSEMNCVVLTEDAAALVATVPEEDAIEIAKMLVEVDVLQMPEKLERSLANWCISRIPELRLNLGAAFPFMRHAIAVDLTRQTSLENAVVAAVFLIPGADLPILTLNQCKLLYQIAVINEVPITRERLVDAGLVVASAFGMRSLSRLLLRKLGPVGWLVRGSIALSATLIVGHLAQELYGRGGGVAELVQSKLGESKQDDTDEQAMGEVN